DRQDTLPSLALALCERLVRPDAREIDQHADRTERLARCADRLCRGFLTRNIGNDADDLRTRHLRADVSERRIHRILVAVDERDARALLAEQEACRRADPSCP